MDEPWSGNSTAAKERKALIEALQKVQSDYLNACRTVALMFKAATGSDEAPRRGIIEDLEDLRAERDRMAALLKEVRSTLEMWKDVAPAVSLCADIDAVLTKKDQT